MRYTIDIDRYPTRLREWLSKRGDEFGSTVAYDEVSRI